MISLSFQWEKEQIFPAHEVFKKLAQAGLLGINKPVEYGGLGLDYKYQMAFLEACGTIRASGVAMGIGEQHFVKCNVGEEGIKLYFKDLIFC